MTDDRPLLKVTFRVDRTPDSKLRPNAVNASKWGVAARRAPAALLRLSVCQSVKSDLVAWGLDEQTPLFTDRVQVHVSVFWERYFAGKTAVLKYRTDVDSDALISMLKPAYDALEDAEVIANDKQIASYAVEQRRDPCGVGYCLITVERLREKTS